jgi:uncharacterized protein
VHLTVFGASGGIGSHVVALATQHGHRVRAVYRTAPQPPRPVRAEVVLAPDIFAPAVAAEAIRGADVVITAVGPNFATRPRAAIRPPGRHTPPGR